MRTLTLHIRYLTTGPGPETASFRSRSEGLASKRAGSASEKTGGDAKLRLIAALFMVVVVLVSAQSQALAHLHHFSGNAEIHCCDEPSPAPAHDEDSRDGSCHGCVCACHAPLVPPPVSILSLVTKGNSFAATDYTCRFPDVFIPLFIPPDIA